MMAKVRFTGWPKLWDLCQIAMKIEKERERASLVAACFMVLATRTHS